MRRRIMGEDKLVFILPEDTVAGDICLYDKTTSSKVFVSCANYEKIKPDTATYVPIGVVVVPGTHANYTDANCAILSLGDMYYLDDEGWEVYDMNFGAYNHHINYSIPTYESFSYMTLTSYNKLESTSHNLPSTLTFVGDVYLPSDDFDGCVWEFDPNVRFKIPASSQLSYNKYWGVSPYLSDGSKNTNVFATTTGTYPIDYNNCFADFAGKSTTEYAAGNHDTNYGRYTMTSCVWHIVPAAYVCDNYSITGATSGWYLPSCGELMYALARKKCINDSLRVLQNMLNNTEVSLLDDVRYWSSTIGDTLTVVYIDFSNGYCTTMGRCSQYRVRAYYRI